MSKRTITFEVNEEDLADYWLGLTRAEVAAGSPTLKADEWDLGSTKGRIRAATDRALAQAELGRRDEARVKVTPDTPHGTRVMWSDDRDPYWFIGVSKEEPTRAIIENVHTGIFSVPLHELRIVGTGQ